MKIGFPRALFYYDYFPFWAGFFYQLGIDMVTSPPTHRQIMEQGLKNASDETCLPLKLLAGHIQALEKVDAIFLPRMVSVEAGTYNCPKFLGIPESLLPAVPSEIPVLTVTLNWRKGKRQVLKDLQVFGRQLGKGKAVIRKAFTLGQEWQNQYQASSGADWDFEETLRKIESEKKGSALSPKTSIPSQNTWKESLFVKLAKKESIPTIPTIQLPIQATNNDLKRLKIALVGHSYLIHEPYANLNLLERLRKKTEVELVQHIRQEDIDTNLLGYRRTHQN